MLQNMKVDIIYYKSNSDFEMEFNLCGCCRMRLLTDKAPDRKTMLHSLARAVSRSRIIIVVGSLFAETGSIPTVSAAIDAELTAIDNNAYGIKSEEEIKIISGATPLVTSDGFFGGCIIESGPQTLILISDNKPIRKEIMNTLIHPYIEELYAGKLLEKNANTDTNSSENTNDNFENSNLVLEESDDTADNYLDTENTELLLENEFTQHDTPIEVNEPELLIESQDGNTQPILSNDEEILSHEEPEDFDAIVDYSSEGIIADDEGDYEESENIEIKEPDVITDEAPEHCDFAKMAELSYMDNNDSEIYIQEDGIDKSYRRGYSLKLPILILSIILLLTIAVLCYCIFFVPSSSGSTPTAFIKETFNTLFG